MSTAQDINTLLSSISALTALVENRIYPTFLPQAVTYPAVRFDRTDDGGAKDFDGQGDTLRTELLIDCVAQTLTEALAIAQTVKDALRGYRGAMGAATVQQTFLETEFDTFEPAIAGGMYRASQAWTIWHHTLRTEQ